LSSRGGVGVTVGDVGPAQTSPFANVLLVSFASGIKRFESTVAETLGRVAGAGFTFAAPALLLACIIHESRC
jgi:hypothetical protein